MAHAQPLENIVSTENTEKLLTAKDLVDRWGGAVSEGTLTNWRCLRKGPAYIKLGRSVRYPESAVVAFEQLQAKRK